MVTTIIMRVCQNWAGQRYLGFYDGRKLIGEVDPMSDGTYRVFHNLNLIGIHADENRAIKQLQSQCRAAITGSVRFYNDKMAMA